MIEFNLTVSSETEIIVSYMLHAHNLLAVCVNSIPRISER